MKSKYAKRTNEQRALTQRQMGVMSEMVSDGASIAAVGRHLQVSQQRSSQIWTRIRESMGPQAV